MSTFAWLAIIVLLLIIVVAYLMVVMVYAPKARTSQRVRQLRFDATATPEERKAAMSESNIPFSERVLVPFFLWIENIFGGFAPHSIRQFLDRQIMLAGLGATWTPNALAGLWFLLMIVFAGLFFMMTVGKPNMGFLQKFLMVLLGAVMGSIMPLLSLRMKIKKRQDSILRQLPEVLDLLSVSVSAGLSFDAALRNIVGRMNGPFILECQRMLQDIRLGKTRRNALRDLADRCDVQDVSLFATSIIQAEQLGASMSHTLEIQADNIRERRRQFVKAQAMKTPVKILFPLILFVFPAIFIILFFPIGYKILEIAQSIGQSGM